MQHENTIVLGDCLDILKQLPDSSVDSVVTDPPYGLGTREPTVEEILAYIQGSSELNTGGDFMGKAWSVPSVAIWKECFRVLKPGGYVLAFGGTRTFDLISLGLRAAGFENRDTIANEFGVPVLQWMHGQGFPKSMNIGKAIDKMARGCGQGKSDPESPLHGKYLHQKVEGNTKNDLQGSIQQSEDAYSPTTPEAAQWEGWGTALKPAWEPVLVFRKPLDGTAAENILKHGVGGINIEGTRVATSASSGRWPANLILTHADGCKKVEDGNDAWECVDGCPVNTLDAQSGDRPVSGRARAGNAHGNSGAGGLYEGRWGDERPPVILPNDSGGASRFFPQFEGQTPPVAPFLYTGKATKREATLDGEVPNNHPTKKPLQVMQWLVRLVTPKGGLCVDPYCGSGTTCVAAVEEGMKFIGIEKDPGYHENTVKRVGLVYKKAADEKDLKDSFADLMGWND